MEQMIKAADWPDFCKQFTARNRLRPTVVQIVKGFGARTEERGLPLLGLDVEHRAGSLPDVIVVLGEDHSGSEEDRHLTHSVRSVLRISLKSAENGLDQLLSIEAANGEHTLLHLLAA